MIALIIAALMAGQAAAPQITQAQLNKFSDRCKTPRAWMTALSDNRITLQPPSTANYRKVDCVLKLLKKSKLPMNLGFIGNEYYEPKAK